ncbi:hypothetical protein [Siphonobacter sp. SORGH_AS_1065]|uniref:hypothetical protein n=1 Tax=Siphonobacter sp. SORGH_AS_1065 TaxID=3041795 RepID=UPI00277D2C21|nr:hypothetical protein [Siphonobacter sp. SORGH_AS_1065]MDQ1089181.1 hypothetical protein [Siphonobacter sp. SORGH_AS_1065]
MKKQWSRIIVLTLSGIVLMVGCSKKQGVSVDACNTNAERLKAAADAYVANQSKANCEAYKKSINDILKSCPTYYSGISKQTLEDFNNTPCD